jgi:NADH-quinone oxidoreductase subunit F
MDLHVRHAGPTDDERAAVDALLGPPLSSWVGGERGDIRDAHVAIGGREQRQQRHLLLPALQALQARVGWISETGLDYVCTRLDVPPADAWGVATFYALLSTTPRAPRVLHVCDDIACQCKGANELVAALERTVGPSHTHGPNGDHVEIDPRGAVWMRSPCLGLCDHAPAAFVQQGGVAPSETLIGELTLDRALAVLGTYDTSVILSEAEGLLSRTREQQILTRYAPEDDSPLMSETTTLRLPQDTAAPIHRRLLDRVCVVDPTDITAYRRSGGFDALRKAVEIGPDAVIREVTDSKLMGRGGAAFPTGRKWDAVAKQSARPHYLICNADESEPGTFKDRVLLEGDPFAIVEAMTIAGFATGCERGFLYIRGEYPLGAARIQNAIDAARAHDFLGNDILGRGIRFDIEIRRGAGAYICGEETAIFNSDRRISWRAAQQAALSRAVWIVRLADSREQRRDAREHSRDHFAWRCRIREDRNGTVNGHASFLSEWTRRAAGRLRGCVWQNAARSPRHGGRTGERPAVAGHFARRRGRRVRRAR